MTEKELFQEIANIEREAVAKKTNKSPREQQYREALEKMASVLKIATCWHLSLDIRLILNYSITG